MWRFHVISRWRERSRVRRMRKQIKDSATSPDL